MEQPSKFKEIRDAILAFAKKWLYQFLIKKIFGAALGGIKGWVVSLVFDFVWSKYLKPGGQWALRKIEMIYRSNENAKKIKELEDAKDEKSFDDASDNLP